MYPLKLKYRKNHIRSSWNVTNDFSVVYRVALLKVSHKVLVVNVMVQLHDIRKIHV